MPETPRQIWWVIDAHTRECSGPFSSKFDAEEAAQLAIRYGGHVAVLNASDFEASMRGRY